MQNQDVLREMNSAILKEEDFKYDFLQVCDIFCQSPPKQRQHPEIVVSYI